MKIRRLSTLCGLVLALSACREKKTDIKKDPIGSDMMSQLACAASSVDERWVQVTGPDIFRNTAPYMVFGKFPSGDGKKLDFRYEQEKGSPTSKTEFCDDLGNIQITDTPSLVGSNSLEFTRINWSSTLVREIKNPGPINESELRRIYSRFRPWMEAEVRKKCQENPFAREISSAVDYDEAVAKTTKPTMVYFKADWCSPCYQFETRMLRFFMGDNAGRFDLVRVNMSGRPGIVETKDEWTKFLEEKYNLKGTGVPLIVYLDPAHNFKGSHIGWDDDFYEGVRTHLGHYNRGGIEY